MLKHLLVIISINGCVTRIPADSMTATRMYALKKRVEIYFEKNKGYVVQITEYIEEVKRFSERDPKEQFDLVKNN